MVCLGLDVCALLLARQLGLSVAKLCTYFSINPDLAYFRNDEPVSEVIGALPSGDGKSWLVGYLGYRGLVVDMKRVSLLWRSRSHLVFFFVGWDPGGRWHSPFGFSGTYSRTMSGVQHIVEPFSLLKPV